MLYWGVKFIDKPLMGFFEAFQDQLVFYRGIYGVPSYLVWYVASDRRTDWIKNDDVFTFFLYSKNKKVTRRDLSKYYPSIYEDQMVIINIIFDIEVKMFKITAISHFWYLLDNAKELVGMEIGTQENPVTGKELITKLVNIANKDQKYIADVDHVHAIPKVKYVSINLDPGDSVLDKISDICLENTWEWHIGKGNVDGIRGNMLYVGDKLVVDKGYAFPFEPEEGHRQIINTTMFISITIESTLQCKPMLYYGKPPRGRVIWVKYFLNNEGGEMSVMIQRVGWYSKHPDTGKPVHHPGLKYLSEVEFIETLDFGLAKEYGAQRIFRYPLYAYAILAGKMFGNPTDKHRIEYSAPEWSGDATAYIKDLNKRSFKTEWNDKEVPQHYLKNSKITTPFAGDGVGMLFPQVDGHKTLLAPDGERDIALIGPGYFGPDEEVPVRTSEKDFRLQLSNGWVLYVKENGDTVLQIADAANQSEIDELGIGKQGLHLLVDNGAGKKEYVLGLDSSSLITFTNGTDGILQMVAEGAVSVQAENGNVILLSANGDVSISAAGNKVLISAPTVKLDGGTVDINGVTIAQGGIIKCTTLTAGGMTIPVKIPPT